MIEFEEKDHSYFFKKKKLVSVSALISNYKKNFNNDFWSTYKALEKIIGKEEFKQIRKGRDWRSDAFLAWACNLVNEEELIKEVDILKKEWIKENADAINKGKQYHSTKEKQAYSEKKVLNPFTNKTFETKVKPTSDVIYFHNNLYDLEDGFYPELVLWNEENSIAGTADKVWVETINGERFIDIDDYKTNKKISKSNYFEKMNYPLNHLDDCTTYIILFK